MKKSVFLLSLLSFWFSSNLFAQIFKVTDHGAVGDGSVLNTEVLQKLIDKVSDEGGGKIVFPVGTFLTGSLELKSNVELFLEEDALLLGSTDPFHYKKVRKEIQEKGKTETFVSQLALIIAHRAENIAISGEGTIDSQGRELALNIDSLHHAGIVVDPKYRVERWRTNESMRPKLIRFTECKNIKLTNIHFRNSACWGLCFALCSDLVMDGLTIFNRAYWNNDGMDISDCTNVRITNCDIDAADDGICLKSHKPGHYNDSIYIANCTVRSSASAVKFGTASHGGFKNVVIENIKVYDTYRSAIAIESVDGGHIENIEVSNIIAKNTGNAIFIRLGHRQREKPGTVKNIHIRDIQVQVPFGRPDIDYDMRASGVRYLRNPVPSSITGIPGHVVENVVLENIEITYPGRASKGMAYIPLRHLDRVPEKVKNYPEFTMFGDLPSWGFYVRHVSGIKFKNINLKLENDDYRPAFVFDEVKDIELENILLPSNKQSNQFILKDVTGLKRDKVTDRQFKTVQ